MKGVISDETIIRKARFRDIMPLTKAYCNLPQHIKKFFHPFPFDKKRVALIFFIMWLDRFIIPIVKEIIPKLGANLVVAYDIPQGIIAGFAFFSIIRKEESKFIANAGPLIFENFQGMRLGQRMYEHLIKCARDAGVSKFQITILESNVQSIMFHTKIGFVRKGYAKDEFWDGNYEKNLALELDIDSR